MTTYIDPTTGLPQNLGEIFSDRNIRVVGQARVNPSNANQIDLLNVQVICSPIAGGAEAISIIPNGTYALNVGASLWIKISRSGTNTATPTTYAAGSQPLGNKDYLQLVYQVASGQFVTAGNTFIPSNPSTPSYITLGGQGQKLYFIVGSTPNADFSDLWTALASSQVVAGSRLLVVSNQTTSITRTIQGGLQLECASGITITSTLATGTAFTFNGNLITYNLNLVLNGAASGVLIAGSNQYHQDLTISAAPIAGTIPTVITFAVGTSQNRIVGSISGTAGVAYTTSVVNLATAQSLNTYDIAGQRIYFIVGTLPNADFPDLWTALASSLVVTDSKLLIVTNQITSIARTIQGGINLECASGVTITSTLAAGTAFTFNGNLTTNNLNVVLNGAASGISIAGSNQSHQNLTVTAAPSVGIIPTVVTFAPGVSQNKVTGAIIGTAGTAYTTAVLNSSTLINTYNLAGPQIYFIVGLVPNADFPDLWTALAAVSAGSKLIVVTNQTTSIARTIQGGIQLECASGVTITSTLAAGIAFTFNGNLATYNLNIVLNGAVTTGISITGTNQYHQNLKVTAAPSAGIITTVITFAAPSSQNNIVGSQIVGTMGAAYTTAVSDLTTAQSVNTYKIATNADIFDDFGVKVGLMHTASGYARITSPTQSILSAGSQAFDCSVKHIFYVQGGAGGTATYTLSNLTEGQTVVIIVASSGSAYTLAWSPTIVWGPLGLPVPTSTASKYDLYTFIQIGNHIFGTVVLSMG